MFSDRRPSRPAPRTAPRSSSLAPATAQSASDFPSIFQMASERQPLLRQYHQHLEQMLQTAPFNRDQQQLRIAWTRAVVETRHLPPLQFFQQADSSDYWIGFVPGAIRVGERNPDNLPLPHYTLTDEENSAIGAIAYLLFSSQLLDAFSSDATSPAGDPTELREGFGHIFNEFATKMAETSPEQRILYTAASAAVAVIKPFAETKGLSIEEFHQRLLTCQGGYRSAAVVSSQR